MPKKMKHPSPSIAGHPTSSAGDDTLCRTSGEVAPAKNLAEDVDDNRTLPDMTGTNGAHAPSCTHGLNKDAAVTWNSIRELEQNVFQRVLAKATDQMQSMIDGNFDIYNAHGNQNIPSCSCCLPSISLLDAAT
jgi:hypothetical protein